MEAEVLKKDEDVSKNFQMIIGDDERGFFVDEEWNAYRIIKDYRDNESLQRYKNRHEYISLMKKDPMEAFALFKGRYFDAFTEDMAMATFEAFCGVGNYGKANIISGFKNMWKYMIPEQNEDWKVSRDGCEKLLSLLQGQEQKYANTNKNIAQIHTNSFIMVIKACLESLETSEQINLT